MSLGVNEKRVEGGLEIWEIKAKERKTKKSRSQKRIRSSFFLSRRPGVNVCLRCRAGMDIFQGRGCSEDL